jgi:hypothetical protein
MISRRGRHWRKVSGPVVEEGLTLNIDQLIKARLLIPGSCSAGQINWTYDHTGQRAGAVGYEAQLAIPNAYLRLYFTVGAPGNGASQLIKQEIRLTTTRPRFGGIRWWFICPHTGARVGRLHLPSGASQFAARRAHGLRYGCQTENKHQRATRRASKLIARLGGRAHPFFLPCKPKRMRWSTYSRAVNQLRRWKPWLMGG